MKHFFLMLIAFFRHAFEWVVGWKGLNVEETKRVSAPHEGRVKAKKEVRYSRTTVFRRRQYPRLPYQGGQFSPLVPPARRIA